ncbi:hypothetical protein BB561_003421 [Smittium simulii]|uniref:GRIP domain-containing protein n=1 Tax=Smittium simulii TaxID=133385 RepID=A0A2T9YLM5_9FUNG|nr:hypothetical protein BB561_003421 [Smittium simulii]
MASAASSPNSAQQYPTLTLGEPLTPQLIERLNRAQKNDKLLKDMSRAYKKAIETKKAVEAVLRVETHIESLSEVDALSDYFKNINLKVKIANEELLRLNNRVREFENNSSSLETLASANLELKTSLESTQADLKKKDSLYSDLLASFEKIPAEPTITLQEIASLKDSVSRFTLENTTLKQQISELNSDKNIAKDLNLKINDLSDTNSELSSKLSIAYTDNKCLNTKLSTFENTIQELQTQIHTSSVLKDQEPSEPHLATPLNCADSYELVAKDLNSIILNESFDFSSLNPDAVQIFENIKLILNKKLAFASEPQDNNSSNNLNDSVVSPLSERQILDIDGQSTHSTALDAHKTLEDGQSTLSYVDIIDSDKYNDLKNKLNVLETENSSLIDKLKNLENPAKKSANINQGKKKNSNESSKDIQKLNTELKKITSEYKALQNDLNQANDTKEELAKELESLKNEASKLSAENNNLSSKSAQFEEGIKTSLEDKNKLIEQLEKSKTQNSQYFEDAEALKKLNLEYVDSTKKISVLEAQLQSHQAKIEKLSAEKQELETKFSEINIQLNYITGENVHLQKKADNAETSLKEKINAQTLLMSQVNLNTTSINENAIIQKNKQLVGQNEELKKINTLEVEKAASLEESIKKNNFDLENKVKEFSKLESTLQQQRVTISEHEKTLIAVQQDLTQTRTLYNEKCITFSKLQTKFNDLQFNNDKLVSQTEVEKKLLQNQLIDAEQELKEIQTNYQQEIKLLQCKIESLLEELKKFKAISEVSQNDDTELIESKAQLRNQAAELDMLKANIAVLQEKINVLTTESMELQALKQKNIDLSKQLKTKGDEAKMAAVRWKQIHRDLKEELRKLQRELNAANINTNDIGFAVNNIKTGVHDLNQPGGGGHPRSAIIGAGTEFISPGYKSTSFTNGVNRRLNSMGQSFAGNASMSPFSTNKLNYESGKSNAYNSMSPESINSKSRILVTSKAEELKSTNSKDKALESTQQGEATFSNQPNVLENNNIAKLELGQSGVSSINLGARPSYESKQLRNTNLSQTPNSAHSRQFSTNSETSAENRAQLSDTNMINVDYLRHVLFKFFIQKDRRSQLVPVLSLLLKCSPEEIKTLQKMTV